MRKEEVTKTYWYSDDGYEFSSEAACRTHEEARRAAEAGSRLLYIQVPWPITIDGDKEARLYTLHTEADFQSLAKYLSWYKNDMREVLPPETYPCLYCVVDSGTHFPIGFQITKQKFSDLTVFYETIKNYFLQENHNELQ